MAQTVNLWGATYSNVPAINVPSGNGTARFTDASVTTAIESDVTSGEIFIKADGSTATGTLTFSTIYTGSSTPSSSTGVNGDIYLQI